MPEEARRRFRVRLAVRYVGGSLPTDDLAAFEAALSRSLEGFTLRVADGLFDSVEIFAEVRAPTSVDAAARLDRAVDAALLRTGLFERFDVSGKSLHVHA
ncbi:hypothetical protein ACTOB_005328 [Actinoplanes oblitus]|uniref:Uncharacterized protein n=1 Tax=Actinoplanes oblitus TaxID=3040509 RepID=A0ABY8W694_9ACTN|nr:hypothetical protein [Actinoplanes oblitus]WIM93351.1 hypothetical protein ACTOB_005328 [Actinoplanes oblitus]